ncbi:PEP-utilizing enzyme [Streptomyces sp. NPDC101169]|uniref:PEP-utilizing enzyme n=1 Tax=Streptomyces sp. NPDC101169 TaxID=3366121 RepID=UPI00380E871E
MILFGRSASPGRVRGRAWRWNGTASPQMDIALVMGPLRIDAISELSGLSGVVAAIGGVTSHPANVLRARGVPLLVAVAGLDQISDGSFVELDCYSGSLRVISCDSDT